MQNAIFGEYLVQTDTYGGEKLGIVHIPSGNQFAVTKDGGIIPQAHANGDLPASPETAGTLFHDSNRGTPAWWDRDHYEFPVFVADVLVDPVTVAGTTTRTTVWNPDINPDSLIRGRTYQLDMFGTFTTANTSSTFALDIDLAGTDVAGVQNVGGNATDAPWSIEFTFTVRSDGENGELQPHTRGLFNSEPADSHGGVVSVDTTTSTALNVSIQWDDGSSANSATVGQAHLKQMG